MTGILPVSQGGGEGCWGTEGVGGAKGTMGSRTVHEGRKEKSSKKRNSKKKFISIKTTFGGEHRRNRIDRHGLEAHKEPASH